MFEKLSKWWWFHMANPIVRKGEAGGFKWKFRRFWLDIETVSGNFKARFMAAEHPYAYLLAGQTDDNIHGFCQTIYMVGMLLTTDQGFVGDVGRAIQKYDKRLQKANPVVEDETEEKIALEEVKQVEDYAKMASSERKKIDKKFKSAIKKIDHEE